MATALYPGAFKPPHRGHFEVVKKLLDGSHGGKIYDKDTVDKVASASLAGESDKVDTINKVVVFIGGKDRNGISPEISKAIWDIYKKYLGNVELYYEVPNPMQNASAYAKKRPNEKFYAVTGIRGEEDLVDLRRITSFKNRDNVQGLVFAAPGGVRATDLRKAVLSGNLDQVTDFFPKELNREEILTIVKMLKDSIIAEMMNLKIENLFNDWLNEDYSSAMPTRKLGAQLSVDRSKLVNLYNYINNLVPQGFKTSFKQSFIKIEPESEHNSSQFDFTPFMGSLLEYMLDEGMKIQPLPEIKIKRDLAESQDFFGRTAYYDPNLKEIVLYVEGRHPKDVMRSFTHEMVHHIQNLDGRLENIQTSNTNEDDSLLEIEKEAYLTGNITFRNWEDKIKNENK